MSIIYSTISETDAGPLFSVIIPAYNCAFFLREALQSLQKQLCRDFEVIITDSCSTDGTDTIAGDFPELPCTVCRITRIGNIGASRNLAVSHAKGRWLAFLDADDFWCPEKLAVIKSSLSTYPDAIAFCHSEYIIKNNNILNIQHYVSRGNPLHKSLIFIGNSFSTAATVLRRDIFERVGGFDEDQTMVTAEDYDLWIRASRFGKCIFLPDVLGYYRLHGSNSTNKLKQHLDAIEAVLRKHLIGYAASHRWSIYRRMFRFTVRCAVEMSRHRDWGNALRYGLRAATYGLGMLMSWRPGVAVCPHDTEL